MKRRAPVLVGLLVLLTVLAAVAGCNEGSGSTFDLQGKTVDGASVENLTVEGQKGAYVFKGSITADAPGNLLVELEYVEDGGEKKTKKYNFKLDHAGSYSIDEELPVSGELEECELKEVTFSSGSGDDEPDSSPQTEPDTGDKPQVLLFTQEGCSPCVPAERTFEKLAGEMSNEVVFKEIWAHEDMATFNKYGVMATPTIIILDSRGDVAYKRSGAPSEDALRSEIGKVLGQ